MTQTEAVDEPKTVRRTPAEPGVWLFLFGDMLVFGVFFATFMVERAKAPGVFDASRKTLHVGVGLTNTIVLLTSSLFVVAAIGAIKAGAMPVATKLLCGGLACGLVFIGLKTYEYSALVAAHYGIGKNHFYLYYVILTGLHLLHVCVGLIVLVLLIAQARRVKMRATAISSTRMAVIEGGGCFWHLVDLLWIVLFPLLYLVS